MSIIIFPLSGLINRLNVISSAIALSTITRRRIYLYWTDEENLNSKEIFDHTKMSIEDLFIEPIHKCPIDLVPDACFSEWIMDEYLNDKKSLSYTFFEKNIIEKLNKNSDDLYNYLINNPDKNVLIETSTFIKINVIDKKIWDNLIKNTFSELGKNFYQNILNLESNHTIKKALYGLENNYFDVTNIIKNLKSEYIDVSNTLFGDPYPFKKKLLYIEFNDGTSKSMMEGNKLYFTNDNNSNNKFGFIITRCVKNELHDVYWKECYQCIRKIYDEEIIIIDDNSDQSLVSEMVLINTRIIKSEFLGSGELLPYYYYYKYKFFSKAIILHDSMFIQKKIDFGSIGKFKFLWHFENHSADTELDISYMKLLKNSLPLTNLYYSREWHGCFGVASVIDYDVVMLFQEKYNLFVLLDFIKTRKDRMTLERIFGTIMFNEKMGGYVDCSLFGYIGTHLKQYGFTYQDYLILDKTMFPIIKVWTGR